MIKSALLLLAAANAVRAQVSTASLFPVGFMDDDLQGRVVGTGAGGTTYVLSAPEFDTLDIPYTLTLVEDATHISEGAVIATAGVSVTVDVRCGMSGGEAVCTQIVAEGGSATTITESGAVILEGIPVLAGTATGTFPVSTISRTPSITFSSTTPSVLPPSISVSSSRTTSSPSTTGLIPSAESSLGSSSGALKNCLVGFWFGLSGVAMILNSL